MHWSLTNREDRHLFYRLRAKAKLAPSKETEKRTRAIHATLWTELKEQAIERAMGITG